MKNETMNRYIREGHVGTVLCLLTVLSFVGCQKKDMSAMFKGMSVNVVAVKTVRQPISEKISLVGTMAANEAVEIKSEIDGIVETIGFEEGQNVKKDQVLIEVDRKKLQASLSQAQANLKLAEITKDRYALLVESNAISKQEYDQALATFDATRAEVEKMNADLHDATITASFDGVMGERLVSLGQFISKGTSLSLLINQDPMKAEFRVPERYISKLKIGQEINVVIAAYPSERFKGEVYFIDPQVDELTRTALVKARVPNSDTKLRRGMFANLDLIVDVRANALVVPETAIIPKGEDVFVFVVDQKSKAQMRPIKIGTRVAGMVEVVAGLEEGEVVITEGYQKIGPGSNVAVKDPNAPVIVPEDKKNESTVESSK